MTGSEPRNHKIPKYHVGLFTEAVAMVTILLVFSPEGARCSEVCVQRSLFTAAGGWAERDHKELRTCTYTRTHTPWGRTLFQIILSTNFPLLPNKLEPMERVGDRVTCTLKTVMSVLRLAHVHATASKRGGTSLLPPPPALTCTLTSCHKHPR